MNYRTSSKAYILPFLFIMALYVPLHAQIEPNILEEKVDSLLSESISDVTPGSAVLVIKDKEIVLNKGYGLANLDYDIPIMPSTVFDLASVSKQFAGYAIASLAEQGVLSEEDDVRKYIPELPEFDQTITIAHLLHHTSGIRDWTSTLPLSGRSFEDVISMDHILRMAFQQEDLNFTPGSEYRYSNTGYNLLAEIVQRTTGLTFREWTDQHIFQPLGMTQTLFLDDHNEVIKNRAIGYYQRDDEYRYAPNTLTALGSSSMYSTTTDMAKWANHIMYPADEKKAVVERMMTTRPLSNGNDNNYAYGISRNTFRGTPWISHSGGWASFRTYITLLPEQDLAIVVLSNNSRNPFSIAGQIAGFYVPEETTDQQVANSDDGADPIENLALSDELLDAYVGTYKLGTGWYVHLTKENGQLWTQATNEDKYPMFALSDSLFQIPDYGDRTMQFYSDESGAITHLVYNDITSPKMSAETEASLTNGTEYEGEYISSELNTSYTVMYDQGELKLWNFHHGDIPLQQAWNDDFSGSMWYTNSVEFKRDEQGNIVGLSVSQYRARNQFFRKKTVN
ncbi:MAG: serine hydrolase domain-containing protein [Bacteroidota bacterium]